MRSPCSQTQSWAVRIVLTAAVGIVLLSYGWSQLHAAAAFIGVMVTVYTLYGFWFKWFLYADPVHITIKMNEEGNGMVHRQLAWCTTLSSTRRLPWLYVRVEEVWELVSDEGRLTEGYPNRFMRFTQATRKIYDPLRMHERTYDEQAVVKTPATACPTNTHLTTKRYWRSTKLIHPNGRKSFTYSQSLSQLPRGIYRYVRTELYTGDIWGWFTKKISSHNVRLPASDIFIMPGAGKWQEWNKPLPVSFIPSHHSRIEKNTASSYSREGVPTPELRSYQSGDPWRSIHWRSYAKHRQLNVIVPCDEVQRQLTIVLDESWQEVAAYDGVEQQQLLEEALDAAAEWCSLGWKEAVLVKLVWLSQGEVQVGMEAISRALASASSAVLSTNDIHTDSDQQCSTLFVNTIGRSNDKKALHHQFQGNDVVVISHLEVADGAPRVLTQLRGCRIAVWVTLTDYADGKQSSSMAADELSSLPLRKEKSDYAASSH
ncbi:DUF58 domain-containing protein [Paenibacillus taiwanensis]|uniref:DUF58 domain-containing protein n=1 Tax=Paenibacillus taiwanensis TaxID=401638 RepID=UPI000427CFCF|nr:DUF58 domain-containing protein [Paenibacillus taiwanensis]